jgi:predicted phosphate transport protein (TIGR00153 family)
MHPIRGLLLMSMAIAVAVSTGMGYAVERAGIDRIAAVVLAVLTFFLIAVPAVAGFGWSFRRAGEIDHLARRTRRAAAGRYIGPVRDKSLSVEADELARAIDELFRQHGGPAQGTPIDAGNHLIESARFSGGLRLPRFRLIPREESFYAQFTAMADQIRGGARLLEEMFAPNPPIADKAYEIKEVEHKCDFITHEIIQRLNKTFVTPIDREDIHAMARALDDVMDAIDNAAALVPLYHIEHVRFGARELSHVIAQSCDAMRLAVAALQSRSGVLEHAVEINRLENEADRLHQRAVGQLFDEEHDPIAVMKWKEILDLLEDATDRTEDVANLLENIVVKHG